MGHEAKGIGHSEKGKERTRSFSYDVVSILSFFIGKTIVRPPPWLWALEKAGVRNPYRISGRPPRPHRGVGKEQRPGYEPEKTESAGGQDVVSEPPGS